MIHPPALQALNPDSVESTRGERTPAVALNVYVLRLLGRMRLKVRRKRPNIVIVFATVTGTTRDYAFRLANLLSAAFAVEVMNAEEYATAPLTDAAVVLQLTSTYGSGAPPTTARKWLKFVTSAEGKSVRHCAHQC